MSTHSVHLVSLEDAADEFHFHGDIRTWFLITAAAFPDFPRFFRGSSVQTDVDLAADWLAEKGLTHFLVQSGYIEEQDGDEDGETGDDNPVTSRGTRRR